MPEGLTWPPKKEDLERLYLVEKLSASKIAKAYGLNYPSNKTAESTILYHLRKNGIGRRDRAEHIRKVTEEMTSEWVRRYQAGESLRQIAGRLVDSVTVWNHLRKEGTEIRDKVSAQIESATKHSRVSFAGGSDGKAYLRGLTQGDLYVASHGRLIRVKTASTHPAMRDLLKSCFGGYGPLYTSPKRSRLTGFEWAFTFDLDRSFDFLLDHNVLSSDLAPASFAHYVAGLFDAEGSITRNSTGWYELSITNSDKELLLRVFSGLEELGIYSRLVRHGATELSPGGDVWQLRVWRRSDVKLTLEMLPIRHPEKVAKKEIVLAQYLASEAERAGDFEAAWDSLLEGIRAERNAYVKEAERIYYARRGAILAGG